MVLSGCTLEEDTARRERMWQVRVTTVLVAVRGGVHPFPSNSGTAGRAV